MTGQLMSQDKTGRRVLPIITMNLILRGSLSSIGEGVLESDAMNKYAQPKWACEPRTDAR